ncbi:MAG TPA: FAD-binding oxidoreductase [Streptosporangiaceae bacterium]|nr:FAD-binding oxidoreductase [Streptosporangiaceae bacterium]
MRQGTSGMKADEISELIAGACPGVTEAGPADAVAGVASACVAFPATLEEAAAVMRAAAQAGLAVVPRGAGTRLSWDAPPRRCDLVVDMTRMDRVIEHAAGDLVVRVQAGVTMGRLAAALGAAGQRLSLDAPASSTAGGVIATGTAGPLRLRYGTPRDLLIGITVIRADGRVARSGGKVVKNVAGYDIGKLFAGSAGTLGLIADATFRLHPVPPARAFVTCTCTGDGHAAPAGALAYVTRQDARPGRAAGKVAQAVTEAACSALVPSAVEIDQPVPGGPVRVGVLLEGTQRGVAERADRMAGVLGTVGGGAEVGEDPPEWWGKCGETTEVGDGTLVRVAFWAAALRQVLDAIEVAAAGAGVKPAVGGSAGAGVLYARLGGDAEPAAVARFVTALRGAMRSGPGGTPGTDTPGGAVTRGSAVVLAAPPAVRAAVDPWGPVPAIGLMRAVKDQFDPEHRMAPGRFAGGI